MCTAALVSVLCGRTGPKERAVASLGSATSSAMAASAATGVETVSESASLRAATTSGVWAARGGAAATVVAAWWSPPAP